MSVGGALLPGIGDGRFGPMAPFTVLPPGGIGVDFDRDGLLDAVTIVDAILNERGAQNHPAVVPNPSNYVDVSFIADPTQSYKLWIRLKALGIGNDSIWMQFSGSVNAAGQPAYRIGTASGLEVNLEESQAAAFPAGDGRTTAGAR